MTSEDPSFDINNYRDSVLQSIESEIVHRLIEEWSGIKDLFIQAYEITDSQHEVLKQVKIANLERYGTRGIKPTEWASFGSTVKTMTEFSASYEAFRRKCIEFILIISMQQN